MIEKCSSNIELETRFNVQIDTRIHLHSKTKDIIDGNFMGNSKGNIKS